MPNEISRCRPLLGTYVEIRISTIGGCIEAHEKRIDAAFEAIALCARLMSFHDEKSELSILNRYASSRLVTVHPWTYEVLRQAQSLYHDSAGLFDAGVATELMHWGLLPDKDFMTQENNQVRSTIAALDLLPDSTVRYTSPACLDLGGIAKGFAVDKAIEQLQSDDIASAVVNAGGDLRVTGTVDEPVHIRHPLQPDQLIYIGSISEGAVATSSPYFSIKNINQPDQICALVDAKKRISLTDLRSYTVIAPTCSAADALTKILASGMHPQSGYFEKYQAQTFVI